MRRLVACAALTWCAHTVRADPALTLGAAAMQGDTAVSTAANIGLLRSRREGLESELRAQREERDALRARVRHDGRALYKLKRSGLAPIAGGVAALLAHASRVSHLERVVQGEIARVSELDKGIGAAEAELADLELRLAHAQRDAALIEAARAAAERESFERALARSGAATSGNAPDDAARRSQYGLSIVSGGPVQRFAEQRGELALPVAAPSRIASATRAESDGAGLELTTQRGASVRTCAAGRVVFADNYGSYGQLVVVDHGDRYFTVYGGLAEIEVQVGDEVSKSARIGSTSEAPLYFEVRRGTRAQDARAWLGM